MERVELDHPVEIRKRGLAVIPMLMNKTATIKGVGRTGIERERLVESRKGFVMAALLMMGRTAVDQGAQVFTIGHAL
jgi:hypothetical protein